ncbi:hypothetical protein [Planctomyces sp. SH-PL62]|uniref:hypothetical protein n=1 Tax=Planctomyces sp. SH-PL62 TaxID=1636152 RepID=UPI00078EB8C4|nr:hypothetical protein [Planctomyces sp. SH-PL62]AMV35872.1 hypothetical protein VT85_00410 [Planctomyces sp. SH-PL62]
MLGPESRFSIRGMLLALAVTALLFAALRSGDEVRMVWEVIGGCLGIVAYLRYRDLLAWRASQGLETGRGRKAREAFKAVGVAVLVVGLADFAFLVGFIVSDGIRGPIVLPVAMGLILAMLVARSMRSHFWLPGATRWRRLRIYLKLWPVAWMLVAVIVSTVLAVILPLFQAAHSVR